MWEYVEEITDRMAIVRLNELGKEGWEHYAVDGNTHYFKRQFTAITKKEEPEFSGRDRDKRATEIKKGKK